MTEISLPCCDRPTLVADLDAPIRCDHCGVELELADDVEPHAVSTLAA